MPSVIACCASPFLLNLFIFLAFSFQPQPIVLNLFLFSGDLSVTVRVKFVLKKGISQQNDHKMA